MPAELLQTLDGHTDRIWTLAWNPAGTVLASSGGDKTIRLWGNDGQNWTCITVLTNTHEKSIRRISWSPCGQYLASASFDATICIWKKSPIDASWVTIVNLEGHENEVKSVSWSHDGQNLASCGRDRTIWIWERAPSDPDQDEDGDPAANWDCSDVKNDHTKDVKNILWHPHHNILVSCSYDDTIKFFCKDGDDWKCYDTLTSHTSTVWSVDFSASGEYLATCSDDKTVRVWKNCAHQKLPEIEPNSWKCVSVIQGYHSRTIYDVSWDHDTGIIVSGSSDNSLVFYAPAHEEPGHQDLFTCVDKLAQSHDCDVNCVAWNKRKAGLLASGSDDCKIKLWNYSPHEKGRKPLTIVDGILEKLAKASISPLNSEVRKPLELTMKVTDHSNLLDLVRSLQELQTEIRPCGDIPVIEKLLDLKIEDRNIQPVCISNLSIFTNDGSVEKFSIDIVDSNGELSTRANVIIEKDTFTLDVPRRSIKFLAVADELFLIEKTGDLFKISPSGKSKFQLGHLFMFSDVKFVCDRHEKSISHILSADRDEKIRISRYPETFEIESYCFGHKHFIRRIILVDSRRFVSIDQQNVVNLWNLDQLHDERNKMKPLEPLISVTLGESATKRACRD